MESERELLLLLRRTKENTHIRALICSAPRYMYKAHTRRARQSAGRAATVAYIFIRGNE